MADPFPWPPAPLIAGTRGAALSKKFTPAYQPSAPRGTGYRGRGSAMRHLAALQEAGQPGRQQSMPLRTSGARGLPGGHDPRPLSDLPAGRAGGLGVRIEGIQQGRTPGIGAGWGNLRRSTKKGPAKPE
jgi:hypothetical protein